MSCQISLVANAIRPQLWKRFCNSLTLNKCSFEVIFVGPNPPTDKLPEFFRYVDSDVKPSQRMEIAVREAKGELISLTSDDINYNHADLNCPKALDVAWASYVRHGKDPKIMFQPDTYEEYHDGVMRGGDSHRFIFRNKNTPLMRTNGFTNREFYMSLGGYDKNFIAGQADNDCVLRAYQAGASVLFDSNVQLYIHHNEAHRISTSQGTGWDERDRKYLEKCWINSDGMLSSTRLSVFEPFVGKDILTINQGIDP